MQVITADGLYLHGYYAPSENKEVGLLHIHGFEGNFYENNFVHVMANEFENENIGFLVVNTRGNGKETDFNMIDGSYKKVGARYELLEEAHLDISAWLKFLIDEKYKKIILCGHSLGTMKSIRYLFEGEYKNKIDKLVLLSPFDKKGLLVSSGRKNISELIKKAQKIVGEGRGEELITREFEEIVISYKTWLSWYGQDDFGRVFEFCSKDYGFPILKQIKIPTKIVVGSKDEYFYLTNPEHPEEAMKILLENIPNSQGKIIENAVHSFNPHEDIIAKEVSRFVLEN